jgi:hypothetical protein
VTNNASADLKHGEHLACRASAANFAAAERLGQALHAHEDVRLLGDSGATTSDTVAVEMRPIHNALMDAEQSINAELAASRDDLGTLSKLQNAAQEVLCCTDPSLTLSKVYTMLSTAIRHDTHSPFRSATYQRSSRASQSSVTARTQPIPQA